MKFELLVAFLAAASLAACGDHDQVPTSPAQSQRDVISGNYTNAADAASHAQVSCSSSPCPESVGLLLDIEAMERPVHDLLVGYNHRDQQPLRARRHQDSGIELQRPHLGALSRHGHLPVLAHRVRLGAVCRDSGWSAHDDRLRLPQAQEPRRTSGAHAQPRGGA